VDVFDFVLDGWDVVHFRGDFVGCDFVFGDKFDVFLDFRRGEIEVEGRTGDDSKVE